MGARQSQKAWMPKVFVTMSSSLGAFVQQPLAHRDPMQRGDFRPRLFAPLRYTDSCASDLLCLLFAEDALVDLELSNLWSACAVKFNLAIPKSFNTDLGHVRR